MSMFLLSLILSSLSVISNGASLGFPAYENALPDPLGSAPRSKCMDDLGCFELDGDFYHPLYRPFNVLPADREQIGVKFLLHTRKNVKQHHVVKVKDDRSIKASGFDAEKETKFLIHGYLDNQFYADWMRHMKNEFLMHGDYNVIIVDWSGGNQLPYLQATSNTRVVGAEIAFLVNYLQQYHSLKPEMVHVLGHSLGAHVAGYAGEQITNLGRITGMDPAEPFFQGLPPRVRLDQTDAKFVDVIHTDSKSILLLGLGMSDLVGHLDFFPNNGKENPGCLRDRFTKVFQEGLITGARSFIACNHQRAVDFMVDSINDHQCQPVGYTCPDWELFLEGRCTSCGIHGEKCAIMGMRAIEYKPLKKDNNSTKLYLKTSDKSPFCLFSYEITVSLQRDLGTDRTGTLTVKILGSKNDDSFQVRSSNVGLYPGSIYTAVVTTSKDLGEIEAVKFQWKSSWIKSIFRTPEVYVESINILPLNFISNGERETYFRSYCNSKASAMKSGEEYSFYQTDLCKRGRV